MLQKKSSVWRYFDLWLVAAVILLTAYGILMIRSAVTGAPAFEPLPMRQAQFALAGLAVMLVVAAVDYRILTSSHWYIYLGLIASLVLVMIIGTLGNASRRWIDLGFVNIQPSEFGRLFMAITFGQYLAERQHRMGRFSNTMLALLYFAVPIGLIFIQPDLGMSIQYIFLWFMLIFIAGLPVSHFAVLAVAGVLGGVALVPFLADYQRERLLVFFTPDAVPEQAFNIEQAVISIGTGGWFGQGYLQGPQTQLGFLRVQHTDFIFSVITHEMGLIFGSLVVLGLVAFILWRILQVAHMTTDPAGRLICVGVAGTLFFQTVVNVGMNVRLMPVTGLTFPFVSYGGSSLVTLFMAIGLVQSVRMRHRKQEFG